MKQHLTILLFLLSLVLSPAVTNAQTPLSLKAAKEYAIKNNLSIRNAHIDVQIQEAQNKQVLSASYPRIAAKEEFTDNLSPFKTFLPAAFTGGNPGSFVPVGFSPKYSNTASVSGSQLIYDGGTLVALQARKSVMELARQNGKLTEENIIYGIQKAYYSLVIAQKQYSLIKSSLASARSVAHDVSVLKANGYVEKIDLDRITVQVNNLATDSMRVGNILEVTEQMLKYQIGMDIRQPIVLTDTVLDEHIQQATALTMEPVNYRRRTEMNMLEISQKLNGFSLWRYRYSLFTLSAFGNVGYNYASNTFSDLVNKEYVSNSMFGLQLQVPIFTGFLRTNQIREVKLNIEKTNNNIENLKKTIDFQMESSRAVLKNSILQLENQRRNMELSASVLNLSRRKYKEGVGSNLELTQTQTDYLQSQNNYFNSLLEMINAEADLQKALGDFK